MSGQYSKWPTPGSGGGGSATWGTISGTLSNQTDLNLALIARLLWRGDWDNSTQYKVNDTVTYQGSGYVALQEHHSATPPNPTYWAPLGGTPVYPLLAPDGDAGSPPYGFITDTDSGMFHPSDGVLAWSANGVQTMTLTGPDLAITGNFTAANFPPIGSANSVAVFDPSGALTSLPGWSWSADGSVNINLDLIANNGPFQTGAGIDNGVTADHMDYFYNFFANNGTITNNTRMIQFDVNGTTGQDFTGLGINNNMIAGHNITMVGLYNSGNTGGDYRLIDSNQSGAISGNAYFLNVSNNGPITQNLALANGNNSAPVGGNFDGVNFSNNGHVTGQAHGLSFFNAAGVDSDIFMLNMGNNSGAYTVGGGFFGVNLYNNVDNDHVQLANLDDNSVSAAYKNGLNINFQGSAPQVIGINISLNSVTCPQQKQGLNINDGSLNVDSNWDTAVLGNPGGEFQLNSLGGEFHVAAGHPVTDGSFGFGNNIGITLLAEDDFPQDSSGVDLGFSINGFVDQIAVVAGKTFHTLNYMAAGGGIAAQSTGGTIENLSMFRSLGLLPEGGSLLVTNLFGFKADPLMDAIGATNLWGVYVGATTADNWFAKNVVIGGITGHPTGAFALDVTGAAVVSGDVSCASVTPANGVSGTFITADAKTVTVTNGIITSIV